MDVDRNEFVCLHARTLQKILHWTHAKAAVDVLLGLNTIETDNQYTVGKKSKGFRFKEPYNNVKFKEVKDFDWSSVSDRLLYGERLIKFAREWMPEHEYLYDLLKRVTLEGGIREVLRKINYESPTQEDYYERSVDWIQTASWSFTVGENSGRVFTNVTNFPREFRPYLRLLGKPLCEVDISACQPLLMVQFYSKQEKEKERFLEAVLSGKFYELLNSKLLRPFGPERRDRLKEAVFTQICFDRIRPEAPPLLRVFQDLFPVLAPAVFWLLPCLLCEGSSGSPSRCCGHNTSRSA
jgi:hypothetical protein